MEGLRPCPFDGSTDVDVYLDEYKGWTVFCNVCDTQTDHYQEASHAISHWNARPAEDANPWIPIDERLPDKDSVEVWEMYIVKINRYGEELTAALYFMGDEWLSGNMSKYTKFVTHWKPMA